MNTYLEKEILIYGLLIGIGYQFYQSVLSIFPVLFPIQLAVNASITVILILLLITTRKRRHVQFIAFVLHLLALAGFSYFWIMYGGLAGTVASFLCFYILFIVITSHGFYQWFGLALLLLQVGIFLLFPQKLGMTGILEPDKISEVQKSIDYLVIAAITIAFTLYIKKKFIYYRAQSALRHQQLNEIAKKLADQNHELATQEEETRAINENLEALVEERIEEIEKKNKALSEYAFINAHMLRGPLCRFIGLIQLMENNPAQYDSRQLNQLKESAKEIDRLIKTINAVVS